jgi:hypothetical protein
MFLAIATRLDISYAVSQLMVYTSKPGEIHWNVAKWVLRYLKGTRERGITYQHQCNFRPSNAFYGYSDASFGDHDDGKSTSRHTFTVTHKMFPMFD